ncbi:MAG TPA: serine/threonine-protein kinase [Kofleriaceae bacterium]|jgi:serine/threonine-protein kinase
MQNSPTRSSIDVGSVIDETYTIEGLIGRGGMGAVFLASHRRLAGKKVAIKMLLADLGGDEILARFKREADIASSLDHPNIVKVENYNVLPDGTPYIAYEFLQGESLAQRIEAGPLPLEQVFSIMRGVGSALAAAHRAGVVHRDLKPQNIFLVQTEVAGNAIELAKVLDFGISKLRGSQTVKTQDSTLLGTPQYMAPEQATGQHTSIDERTDIFALGAIVYEMLTGRPAFSGASIPEVVFKVVYEQPAPLDVDVPPNVADAIAKAMQKAQGDRFQTVSGFVEALTGQPLAVVPRSTLPPPLASGERKKVTANEAFAQTMGSGDHGDAPKLAPTLPSEPPKSTVPAGVITNAPTVTDKRSPALIAALVLGGAVIVAGAVLFATRRPPAAPPPAKPLAVASPDAVLAVAADAAATAAIADGPAVVAVAADAHVVVSRPPVQPPVQAADSAPDDVEAASRLVKAEAAFARNESVTVERLANMVLSAEHASDRQRAQAHMLRGIIACTVHSDISSANSELRALHGSPAFRRRLLDACHAAGFLTDQK